MSQEEPILLPPQLSRRQGICQTKPDLNFTVNKFDIKGEKILVILEPSSLLVFTKKSKEQRLTEVARILRTWKAAVPAPACQGEVSSTQGFLLGTHPMPFATPLEVVMC